MDKSESNALEPHAAEQVVPELVPGEIVLGTLTGIDAQGRPQIDYPNNPSDSPVAALSTAAITRDHLNRQVALLFAGGDHRQPVIIGVIHNPLYEMLDSFDAQDGGEQASAVEGSASDLHGSPEPDTEVARVDGKKIVIEGKEEVVLKCGDASITLTKAGKILIKGKYLLNRSSGVNRIMGGSVQVN